MAGPCLVYHFDNCTVHPHICGCTHINDRVWLNGYQTWCDCCSLLDWSPLWIYLPRIRHGGHLLDLVTTTPPVFPPFREGVHLLDQVQRSALVATITGGQHLLDTVGTGGVPLACSTCATVPSETMQQSAAITGPAGPLVGTWTLMPSMGPWFAVSAGLTVGTACSAGQLILNITCSGGGTVGPLAPTSVDCVHRMASYSVTIPTGFGCSVPSGTYSVTVTWNTH